MYCCSTRPSRVAPRLSLTQTLHVVALQFVYGTKPPPPVHGVSHSVVLLPGVLTMSWVMGDTAVTITAAATANAWYAALVSTCRVGVACSCFVRLPCRPGCPSASMMTQ